MLHYDISQRHQHIVVALSAIPANVPYHRARLAFCWRMACTFSRTSVMRSMACNSAGLKLDQAKRLKELEKENLKLCVANY